MTPTECVNIVALLAARCPSMRMEDATPDAWYIDLADVAYQDARQAVINLTREQPYVALNELLDEITFLERARSGRMRRLELERQIAAENGGEDDLIQRPVAELLQANPLPKP